jgi:hypothetical protein
MNFIATVKPVFFLRALYTLPKLLLREIVRIESEKDREIRDRKNRRMKVYDD